MCCKNCLARHTFRSFCGPKNLLCLNIYMKIPSFLFLPWIQIPRLPWENMTFIYKSLNILQTISMSSKIIRPLVLAWKNDDEEQILVNNHVAFIKPLLLNSLKLSRKKSKIKVPELKNIQILFKRLKEGIFSVRCSEVLYPSLQVCPKIAITNDLH